MDYVKEMLLASIYAKDKSGISLRVEMLKTNQKQVKHIDNAFYSYNHPPVKLTKKETESIITSLENQNRKLTNFFSSNCCEVPQSFLMLLTVESFLVSCKDNTPCSHYQSSKSKVTT